MINIKRIAPEKLGDGLESQWLKKAVGHAGDYSFDDVVMCAQTGDILVYAIYNASECLCAFTVMFTQYPQAKYITVVHAAGVDYRCWLPELHDFIKSMAKELKFTGIRLIGRKGWAKYFSGLDSSSVMLTELIH